MVSATAVREETWVATSCGQCYCQCGIRAKVVNGIVTKIEGNPKAPAGQGRICSKGSAGVMLMYDPYRVNYPLKRTNPQKGIGVDPQWKRITWDEAMDTIIAKLKATYEKDPRAVFRTQRGGLRSPLPRGAGHRGRLQCLRGAAGLH